MDKYINRLHWRNHNHKYMWSALVPLFFSSSAWRRREKRKQETWKCALSLKLVVIFHGKMQSGKKWKSLLGKHCCRAGMQTIPVTKENFFHRFSPLPRNSFLTHLKQYLELIIFHYTATRSTLDKHVAGEPFSTLNYDENQQKWENAQIRREKQMSAAAGPNGLT